MIYTLYLQEAGVKLTSSLMSRILSTPLLLAASISATSKIAPESIPLHINLVSRRYDSAVMNENEYDE